MTDTNIYRIGTHTYTKKDSKGREEEWSWEVTSATVIALQTLHLNQTS